MKILYFAWVREIIGKPEDNFTLPGEVKTAAELMNWLQDKGAGYGEAFKNQDNIRVAVDQVFAAQDAPLEGAKEVAFFPPVTGG